MFVSLNVLFKNSSQPLLALLVLHKLYSNNIYSLYHMYFMFVSRAPTQVKIN